MPRLTSTVLVIALMALGATAEARALKDQRKLIGTIHAIRLSEHQLRVDAGDGQGVKSFFVDHGVDAYDAGSLTDMSALRKGDRIAVTYTQLGDLAVPSEIIRLD